MFVRLLGIIVLCSVWGCQSLSMDHRTSEATQSTKPKPILTSLSPSPDPATPLTQRMAIPEEAEPAEGVHLQDSKETEPFPTIYFPFNSWEITPEVKERLDATAEWMTHFSTYALTIEGHTDIRGSESYNMVLGIKRAKAVKDYLAHLGIPRTRLDIVSFGKVLVLCELDDEQRCHKFNRRADLLLN